MQAMFLQSALGCNFELTLSLTLRPFLSLDALNPFRPLPFVQLILERRARGIKITIRPTTMNNHHKSMTGVFEYREPIRSSNSTTVPRLAALTP